MKNYLKYWLKPFGELFFFQCNYNINDCVINSVFYSEMLQWWSEFRSELAMETVQFDSIIWNNCEIRIDGNPVYYHNYAKAGSVFVIESFNIAQENGLIVTNFLTWSGVRCSVPKHLRNSSDADRNVALETLTFKCDNKYFDPASSKSTFTPY